MRHRLDPEQIEKQGAASHDMHRNKDSIAARTAEVSTSIAAANVLDASGELSTQASALKEHTHVFLNQTRAG